MFKLKQYGVMVSSWLKKHNKFRFLKSLKATLFLQPLLILFFSLVLMLCIFNLSLSMFIKDEVNTAVQHRYDQLDQLYLGENSTEVPQDSIFSTTYVIVDEDFSPHYISASQDELSRSTISNQVVNYFREHDEEWNFFEEGDEEEFEIEESKTDSQPLFINLEGNTYAVKMQEYEGKIQDYYIRQDATSDQNYYILVFVNTSPVHHFSNWIHLILAGLTLMIGALASGLIFLTSRKLDAAFSNLKHYILKVGRREKDLVLEQFPYTEFNEVGQSVETMNRMIDASQHSQKIFFQNASHELRTPLTSIQGYAEAIQTGVVTDPVAAATIIQEESGKMKQLVDDILTLARVEDFQQSLRLEPVSISELFYDITWSLKEKAEEKGLQFKHHFQAQMDLVMADETLLERAILNVLHNALRYAKRTISLQTKSVKNGLEIQLSNDGEAISSKDLDHIFERFYKGQDGQFGIGLAMTKEIIERHGGSITVDSDPSETRFTIFFPLSES